MSFVRMSKDVDNELYAFALYNIMQEILAGEPGTAILGTRRTKL